MWWSGWWVSAVYNNRETIMTVASGEALKAVQEVLLPGDVVALNIFYWKAQFQDPQLETAVIDGMVGLIQSFYLAMAAEIVDGASLGDLHGYVRDGLVWTLIGTGAPEATFTNVSSMLPQGVAGLIRAYTERPRTIGRKYIAGFGESTQADGVLGSTTLEHMATAANWWGVTKELSQDNNMLAGIWSTTQLSVQLMTDVFVVPVNPGYQRRRRPGVGM
jgi:hypothetical protein